MNEYDIISIIIICLIVGALIGFVIRGIFVDDQKIAGRMMVYIDEQNKKTELRFKITNPEKIAKYNYVIFEVFEIHKDIDVSQ